MSLKALFACPCLCFPVTPMISVLFCIAENAENWGHSHDANDRWHAYGSCTCWGELLNNSWPLYILLVVPQCCFLMRLTLSNWDKPHEKKICTSHRHCTWATGDSWETRKQVIYYKGCAINKILQTMHRYYYFTSKVAANHCSFF